MADPPPPALLFDRRASRQHCARARRAGAAVDFLHHEVGERLIDRLDLIGRAFPRTLEWGTRDAHLVGLLQAQAGIERAVAAGPIADARGGGSGVVADLDLVPFRDASFDLVVSSLVLHWVGDLPGTLVQLRRALKPDGLLLAAMFGGQTLSELRSVLFDAELAEEGGVSPRVSPTTELADAAGLLQRAGFAMPVADSETITVTYPDAFALMRDLRGMGETNALTARRRNFTRRATLARAAALYADRFGDADGRIPATFEVLFLTARAPHPGHPQPRPGPRRRIV